MHQILQPEGWSKPVGYANGVIAHGRQIYVGGQIGWTPHQVFESDDLVDQVRQTLRNIVSVLREGGAEPQHIVSMTWYFTDKQDYLARLREIGAVYRDEIGRHYPAMAAVQVVALMEDRAKVEIQATAVVPE
ncbi:RidA family protein [Rhodoplanes roseus]|uniref:Enamine deaminase RidA n=1 Tax=Rhodoplanes roseus TaxID=29409 RepID=A0A327L2M4_9BRAD|nr:RidA family protein [Rhodoplanes roseus]RAI45350.1 enamine deaminase RidA [Rhodoplanes roseus]